MPASVCTGMGDHIGIQLPVQEIYLSLINHQGQLSLAIPRRYFFDDVGQQ